jgi:gluconolactonase
VYAAPPVIKSEVFARVRDRLRARGNVRMQSGVARDCFLEGPSFDRAGNLYVSNIPDGQIFRVSPQGDYCAPRREIWQPILS